MLHRLLMILLTGFSVAGCATLTGQSAPSCDGYNRRPLNRSMWDWENAKPAAPPVAAVPAGTPVAPGPPLIRRGQAQPTDTSPALASSNRPRDPQMNVAASLQTCGAKEVRHG
jgi:type IV secretion system protein VirB7